MEGTTRAAASGTRPLRAACAAALLIIAATALLAGCASPAPAGPVAPPPSVALGPVVSLLDVPPTTDRVRAVPARDGSVHVLIASNGPRTVSEIVVSPAGEVRQRRTVLTGASVSHLDAAFDREGRLHALVDGAHLVCERGVWQSSGSTPWQGTGIRPQAVQFVPNAPDLVWSFSIAGREIGASGRWEVYGFGGYGAGIIWPWFTRGTRAVVVAERPSGSGPWIVVDPDGSLDTQVIDATADSAGNVYLAYTAAREGLAAPPTAWYYLRLGADLLAGRAGVEWQRPGVPLASRTLLAARGTPIGAAVVVRGESAYRPNAVPLPPHLFGGSRAFRLSTRLLQRPRALVVAEAHDKWVGRGFPIQYVEYDDVQWSAPIEVGLADHGGGAVFGGFIWHAYDLATTEDDRAFAVWPTAQGIVGRWIDARRATSSSARGGS